MLHMPFQKNCLALYRNVINKKSFDLEFSNLTNFYRHKEQDKQNS